MTSRNSSMNSRSRSDLLRILFALSILLHSIQAKSPLLNRLSFSNQYPDSIKVGDYLCTAVGTCEPCPDEERGSPACERYGNRRPLSCQPLRPITPSLPTTSVYDKTTPTSYKEQIAAVEEMPRIISSPLPLVIPSKSTSTLPLSILASQDTEEEEDDDDPTPMRKQLKNIVIGPKKEEETVELDPDLLHSEGGSAPVAGKPIELKRIALDRLKRQLATGKNEEIQTWVACSKIVSKERADYFEFVLCNLAFAVGSVAILIYRHRKIAQRQYDKLAARIGSGGS